MQTINIKKDEYEKKRRDRKRLLKIKEVISKVGKQVIKIKKITDQIK